MTTALDVAMARAESLEAIPAMTDPSGRYWSQPNRKEIRIEGGRALMTQETFNRLLEYSASMPTGVYPGKMWSRHDGVYDPKCARTDAKWMVCWYGPVANGRCAIEFRPVEIVEAL